MEEEGRKKRLLNSVKGGVRTHEEGRHMPAQRCERKKKERGAEAENYTEVKRMGSIKLADRKREGNINTLKVLNNIGSKNKDGEDVKNKNEGVENISIYVYIRIVVGVNGLRGGRRGRGIGRLRNRYYNH